MTKLLGTALAVVMVLTASACSGDKKDPAALTDSPVPDAASTTLTTVAGSPTPTTSGGGTGKSEATTATTSKASSQSAQQSGGTTQTTFAGETIPRGSGNLPFQLTVTPRCVERGHVVNVHLATRANASIAATLLFSDGMPYEQYTVGYADMEGNWDWKPVVPQAAPYGKGEVIVSAQDRSPDSNNEGAKTNGESASTREPIEVKQRC